MEIARFTKRTISYLIDTIICFGLGIGCGVPLFKMTKIPWYFSIIITLAFCFFIYVILNSLFMLIVRGRTLGALICGIKTINNDESKIKFKNILIKNLYLALIPFVIINAVYMLSIHTETTIFDRITDTIVVEIK